MLRCGEVRRTESLNSVTAFASTTIRAARELAIVEIAMAISAVGKPGQLLALPAMTLGADQPCVLPAQRVAGLVMIKLRALHLMPAGGVMAAGAVTAQTTLVEIAVTIDAGTELQTRKPLKAGIARGGEVVLLWVALHALDLLMLSREREL